MVDVRGGAATERVARVNLLHGVRGGQEGMGWRPASRRGVHGRDGRCERGRDRPIAATANGGVVAYGSRRPRSGAGRIRRRKREAQRGRHPVLREGCVGLDVLDRAALVDDGLN
jgi:hypothetical protein